MTEHRERDGDGVSLLLRMLARWRNRKLTAGQKAELEAHAYQVVAAWMRHSVGYSDEEIHEILDTPPHTGLRWRAVYAGEWLWMRCTRRGRAVRRSTSYASLKGWTDSHPGMVPPDPGTGPDGTG
jgi:hypothetical protein